MSILAKTDRDLADGIMDALKTGKVWGFKPARVRRVAIPRTKPLFSVLSDGMDNVGRTADEHETIVLRASWDVPNNPNLPIDAPDPTSMDFAIVQEMLEYARVNRKGSK